MANAVIYARYSSHNQTERSIEGQLEDCTEYAKRCGYTVIDTYIDRAQTGTNDNRENFQRMIADAAKKQFEYIIVYKLDRFARNRYDSAVYKNKIKKYGVRVVSAMEQISDTPEGIILESVLEGMAEYYSANLSQNVKRGIRVAIQNKTFTGGVPPYGYKVVDRHVLPDEKTAPVARWIFEKYAEGVPKKDIIAELNKKGYKTVRGTGFTINSLQHVLSNKKYIGIFVADGEEVEGIYPPIIEKDLFDRVQMKLAAHKRAPGAEKACVKYLLQGKVFCGHCSAPIVGEMGTSATKNKYHYYMCAEKKKNSCSCTKKREKKDFLEWYVVEQTVLYVLTPKRIDYIAGRIVRAYEKDFDDNAVKELENRIAGIEKEIDGLVDIMLQSPNKLMMQRVNERAEILDAQKSDLSIELAKLKIANSVKITKAEIVKWLSSFCSGDLQDEAFRRRIIDTFINSVYVYDDKIVIYYNIKDGKQVSFIGIDETAESEGFLRGEESSCFKPIAPPPA